MFFCVLALLTIAYLCYKTPAFGVASSMLIVVLTGRIMGAAYVDYVGNIEAVEIGANLKSSGAANAFGLLVIIFFSAVYFASRFDYNRHSKNFLSNINKNNSKKWGGVTIKIVVALLIVLYFDMFHRGVFPIIVGMERGEYTAKHAGILHGYLFQYSNFVAFVLGVLSININIKGWKLDKRYFIVFVFLVVYSIITGHRFSAILSLSSAYISSFATVLNLGENGVRSHRWNSSKNSVWYVISIAAIVFLVTFGLIYNSYANVRLASDLWGSIEQRLFVQPIQLWWVTWERVTMDQVDPASALYSTLWSPIMPGKNHGIQFLMSLEIGADRTYELLSLGQQYTGGFPEILFETLGPALGVVAVVASGLAIGYFNRIWIHASIEKRYLTAVFALFVQHGFNLLVIGGMINFFLTWTYWLKIAVLLICLNLERRIIGKTSAAY